MIYIPKKYRKRSIITVASLTLAAVTLYILGELRVWYRMPLELSALVLFAVGISVLSGKLLTYYKYVVTATTRRDDTVSDEVRDPVPDEDPDEDPGEDPVTCVKDPADGTDRTDSHNSHDSERTPNPRKLRRATVTVVRVTGPRETEVARFDTADVYAHGTEKRLAEFEKKHGRVDKVYNYVGSLGSPDLHRYAINFNGKKIMLILEIAPENIKV